MAGDRALHDVDRDELRELAARIRRSRLTAGEWQQVTALLASLCGLLADGSPRAVRKAVGAFDDVLPVRVRSEPGGLALEGPPEVVGHLVHEVELTVIDRFSRDDAAAED
ncbi:hypothetical protein JOD54_004276 [Actinokineospora baliensis]|uniref:hypothetical protein n=1 Tax=Actinokineospora baliensis TaxID=547056 RepID=UPI00195F0646|nr:hypothetical protein [Actinokineospora baliensis]MBM7774072.1 hypothetical protein [Actinokineospora baliensis]